MIPTMPFGRTGHISTRTIFGAAALGGVNQADADRTLELLLQYGVNHIDTAASYGDSEVRIGPWMARHRKDFFLATKTGERSYEKAREEIHRSLERLRVDSFDLIQLHNLVDPAEWDQALGAGGALEAAVEAREQGLVRFIGVTGHGVTVAHQHRRALERFDFDSVLLPYSYILVQNEQYAADFSALAELCAQRNVAMQTIKSITQSPWGDRERSRSTWYAPLEDQDSIDAAAHWVLGNPQVFLNTVGDINVLPKVLDAATRFSGRTSEERMRELVTEQEMAPLFT
jgi:aryl-alcohol dehydrogenase-like predicted oxidoreductase